MKANWLSVRAKRTATGLLAWGAIFCLTVLSGCYRGSREALIDRSILTDDPCAAPCWHGIVPGETTSSEAWDILTELEFIDQNLYPHRGRGAEEGTESFMWRTLLHDDPAKVGSLDAFDGVVSGIRVALDFQLTLQQVLDKFGAPQNLLSRQTGVERITNYIYYFYPGRGLIFVSWADPVLLGEQFVLVPGTPITVVYYFQPTTMVRLLSDRPEYLRGVPFHRAQYLADWNGLGPIDVHW